MHTIFYCHVPPSAHLYSPTPPDTCGGDNGQTPLLHIEQGMDHQCCTLGIPQFVPSHTQVSPCLLYQSLLLQSFPNTAVHPTAAASIFGVALVAGLQIEEVELVDRHSSAAEQEYQERTAALWCNSR